MEIKKVPLTAADDGFHQPLDNDPSWTETSYWAFDLPERRMSLAVYPLFRPNLGICSLAVHLWDHTASVPWLIPYSRTLWHVPMPTGDLTDLTFEGLTYKTLEPLKRYYLGFRDADWLSFDLEFTGHGLPVGSTTQVPQPFVEGTGHYDQSLDVNGELVLNGEKIEIETLGHRDRSWYNRPDNRPRRSASLTCGDLSHGDKFLLITPLNLLTDDTAAGQPQGMLMQGGVEAPVVRAVRRVPERKAGMPSRTELEITDTLGRTLQAEGRALNNFAFQCSPPVFAWFSCFEWRTDAGVYLGEDQEAHGIHTVRNSFL